MITVRQHFRKGRVVRSHSRMNIYRMENSDGKGPFDSKRLKPILTDKEFTKYRSIIDAYHKKVPTIGGLAGIKEYVFGYPTKKKFSENLGRGGVSFLKKHGFKINKYPGSEKNRTIGQAILFKK